MPGPQLCPWHCRYGWRCCLGVHYPGDVAAAWLLAMIAFIGLSAVGV